MHEPQQSPAINRWKWTDNRGTGFP